MGAALVQIGEFGVLDAVAEAAHDEYAHGDLHRAERLSVTGARLAAAVGDEATLRYLTFTRGRALVALGRSEEGRACAVELERRAVGDADPYWRAKAIALRALAERRRGRHPEVLALLARSWVLIGSPDGHSYNQISAAVLLAEALRMVELYEEADAVSMRVAGLVDPVMAPGVVVESVRTLAEWAAGLLVQGRDAEAGHVVTQLASRALLLLRLTAGAPDVRYQLFGLVGLAYADVSLGEPERALRAVEALSEVVETRRGRPEWFVATAVRGLALVRAGRYVEAEEWMRVLRAEADESDRDVWFTVAELVLVRSAVGRYGEHPGLVHARAMVRRFAAQLWAERTERFDAMLAQVRIQELQAESRRAAALSVLDHLTGVGNRRAIAAFLAEVRGPVSALFVDVDDFKNVNDAYSHVVGDAVLARLAQVLAGLTRAGDLVARYGGDEFVLLLQPGSELTAGALERRADEVVAGVRQVTWEEIAPGLSVTVSVGAARMANPEELFTALSRAVLRAKREGRNRRVSTVE